MPVFELNGLRVEVRGWADDVTGRVRLSLEEPEVHDRHPRPRTVVLTGVIKVEKAPVRAAKLLHCAAGVHVVLPHAEVPGLGCVVVDPALAVGVKVAVGEDDDAVPENVVVGGD